MGKMADTTSNLQEINFKTLAEIKKNNKTKLIFQSLNIKREMQIRLFIPQMQTHQIYIFYPQLAIATG